MAWHRRAAVLQFALWLAIFRTGLKHWYLLNEATTWGINPRPEAFFSSLPTTTTVVHNDNKNELLPRHSARFLMGIFTVLDSRDYRHAVRRTLRWYNDSRVCGIGVVLSSSSSVNNNNIMPPPPPAHCRLLYTFVIGANPNGASQIFANRSMSQTPILAPSPPPEFEVGVEPNDLTFLNIKENVNDGKSPTWFNYASRIMLHYDLDYAIKTDMDTALRIDKFFDFADDILPRGGNQIYAGKVLFPKHKPKIPYMAGQFYLLSRDLAEAVGTMPLLTANSNQKYVEDADIGVMVQTASPSVHYVPVILVEEYVFWKHKLKGESAHWWFLKLETIRLCGAYNSNVTLRKATPAPMTCHPPTT